MIQRIQTLFLAAVVILSAFLLTGDLLVMDNGAGTLFTISFTGLGESGGNLLQRLWPLSILIGVVPLLALTAIFLFRKRQLQMRVTMLVLLLSLGTLIMGAFYVLMFDRKIPVEIIWKVKAVFPLLSAILAWLAYRSILKDDLMIRSYDRLR
jgi:glucan phosphoethanolaminetransferase (alkaline phosphatase superfamily)